jgi:hypothetical protein
VLSEQKLYNEYYLRRHKDFGDFDEDGNRMFMHPHCKVRRVIAIVLVLRKALLRRGEVDEPPP